MLRARTSQAHPAPEAERPSPPAAGPADDPPGPGSGEPVPERASWPARPTLAARVTAEEGVDELSLRFDRIRAQLAERGVRAAERAPGERTPGGPR